MTLVQAPILETERLTLRPLRIGDFPAYAAFLATDRAWGMGGPLSTHQAWSFFCNDTAQWTLLGMGGLMVVPKGQNAPIGQVAVCHGPIFPEPELGWFLYDGYEGKGYATEAAAAIRDWAFRSCPITSLVSYVNPANKASARVAERLGAAIDLAAPTPNDEPDDVWRHPIPARAA